MESSPNSDDSTILFPMRHFFFKIAIVFAETVTDQLLTLMELIFHRTLSLALIVIQGKFQKTLFKTNCTCKSMHQGYLYLIHSPLRRMIPISLLSVRNRRPRAVVSEVSRGSNLNVNFYDFLALLLLFISLSSTSSRCVRACNSNTTPMSWHFHRSPTSNFSVFSCEKKGSYSPVTQ